MFDRFKSFYLAVLMSMAVVSCSKANSFLHNNKDKKSSATTVAPSPLPPSTDPSTQTGDPCLPDKDLSSLFTGAHRVIVQGSRAFLTDYGKGVVIYDLSAAPPSQLAVISQPSIVWDIAVEGKMLYVLSRCLAVVDLSDITKPTIISTTKADGSALAVANGMAYVGNESGVEIFNVNHPEVLEKMGSTNKIATALKVAGNTMVTTGDDSDMDFYVWDVADPKHPVEKGKILEDPFGSEFLEFDGTTAYIKVEANLNVIDMSDASHPVSIGSLFLPGAVRGVVNNGQLYVAIRNSGGTGVVPGIGVVDVEDASKPILTKTHANSASAMDLALFGDKIIVADEEEGLVTVEIVE